MSRKNKQRKLLLTLEQQLQEHERVKPGPGQERMAWARRRLELVDAIRNKDAKRLRDPGPDASGNYSPSPYGARGHVIQVAPKDLRSSATAESFPKRTMSQRVIDIYRSRGHIDDREWAAANHLWQLFVTAGAEFRVTAGYDPVFVQSSQDTDRIVAKRVDAAVELNEIWANLPWRSRGCVRAVVIEDKWASDWARERGYGKNQSRTHGLDRLRIGLQGLADVFALDKAGVE